MSETQPQLWIFAGPNGAGKSSLVARYNVASRIPIINPDDIAQEISPNHNGEMTVLREAGRIALKKRKELLQERHSFGVETTLSGKGECQLMRAAKDCGYKINLVYVGLSEVSQSNKRVAVRVKRGGHDVPEQDIMRRFDRSLSNLVEAIKISDRARVLDNSGKKFRLVLSIDKGKAKTVSRNLPEWLKKAVPKEMRELGRLSRGYDLGY